MNRANFLQTIKNINANKSRESVKFIHNSLTIKNELNNSLELNKKYLLKIKLNIYT
jgi:hypothetical protein